MITEEEKKQIKEELWEEFHLMLPLIAEEMAALGMEKIAQRRMVDKFYDDHKELVPYKEVVARHIQKLDAENPGKLSQGLLELAVPAIHKEIEVLRQADFTKAERPKDLSLPNGVL